MSNLTADQVYRDYNTQGVPASGDHKPVKAEIRALTKRIMNQSGSSVTRNTYTALAAVTPPTENYGGIVLDDPDATKNGYYSRVAAVWTWERGFPDTFGRLTLAGTGAARTASVATGVNPSDIEVFFAVVNADNTGAITLSISGGTAREVVNAAGSALTAGEWTGVVLFYLNGAGKYQLINDAGAAAAAASSAAASAASAVASASSATSSASSSAAAGAASGRLDVGSFAELATKFVYSAPGAGQQAVATGDVALWREKGFAYRVAASTATDAHLDYTGTGGVKLYCLPSNDGEYHLEQWGGKADGDLSFNNTTIVANMIAKIPGPLVIRLPLSTTIEDYAVFSTTIYFNRDRVALLGAGRGGKSFVRYYNLAGGTFFDGDTDGINSMVTYRDIVLKDFEIYSPTAGGAYDASTILNLTSFSYSEFDFRAQTRRPNAQLIYGQGNNGASPYYNKISAGLLFGGEDQTQSIIVFERGNWTGGTPGPNANEITDIRESALCKTFWDCRCGQGNNASMLSIESVADDYFVFGDPTRVLHSGFSSGSNTAMTFNDTSTTWTTGVLGLSGGAVRIVAGTGANQIRRIVSNDATSMILLDPWGTIPDNTSTYEIFLVASVGNKVSHVRGEDTAAQNPNFVRAWYNADDITVAQTHADSLGLGSYFVDWTGSAKVNVLGPIQSFTEIVTATGNPAGESIDVYPRSGTDGGMPIIGQYVLERIHARRVTGSGVVIVTADCGGGSVGAGSPSLTINMPDGSKLGSAWNHGAKTPAIGANNPIFLNVQFGTAVVAGEKLLLTVEWTRIGN